MSSVVYCNVYDPTASGETSCTDSLSGNSKNRSKGAMLRGYAVKEFVAIRQKMQPKQVWFSENCGHRKRKRSIAEHSPRQI